MTSQSTDGRENTTQGVRKPLLLIFLRRLFVGRGDSSKKKPMTTQIAIKTIRRVSNVQKRKFNSTEAMF